MNLKKLTDVEREYLKYHSDAMFADEESVRLEAHEKFVQAYNRLKEGGKDVSEFDLSIKLYEGKI